MIVDMDPKLVEENERLLHAMQTGIAFSMGKDTEPKHLRVGVNNALCETSAIVQILVEKGIIDFNEYLTKVNELLAKDVERYEAELSKSGVNVKTV